MTSDWFMTEFQEAQAAIKSCRKALRERASLWNQEPENTKSKKNAKIEYLREVLGPCYRFIGFTNKVFISICNRQIARAELGLGALGWPKTETDDLLSLRTMIRQLSVISFHLREDGFRDRFFIVVGRRVSDSGQESAAVRWDGHEVGGAKHEAQRVLKEVLDKEGSGFPINTARARVGTKLGLTLETVKKYTKDPRRNRKEKSER